MVDLQFTRVTGTPNTHRSADLQVCGFAGKAPPIGAIRLQFQRDCQASWQRAIARRPTCYPSQHGIVRQALRKARTGRIELLFCIINFGGTLYVIERERGLQEARRAAGIIRSARHRRRPRQPRVSLCSRAHQGAMPVSYAEALAKTPQASVMTGDPEFASVAREVPIRGLA